MENEKMRWGPLGMPQLTIPEWQKEELRKRMPFPTKYKKVTMMQHSGAKNGHGSMALIEDEAGKKNLAVYDGDAAEWRIFEDGKFLKP